MAMDQRFFIPWCEFDPTGAHGGIDGELAEGFVAPALGDNTQTTNVDMNLIFKICVATGSSISRHPDADAEGNPGRNLVAEIIAGTNLVLGRILDRTRSESTAFFSWTHATPPGDAFKLRPIRYPLRNAVASEAVFFFLGGLVEIAESNSNAHHTCIDISASHRLCQPFLHFKSNIMRDWFDRSIEGDITVAELAAIAAAGGASADPGGSVLTWSPTADDWKKFGDISVANYKPERVYQPEGTNRTTEDIAPESPTPAG